MKSTGPKSLGILSFRLGSIAAAFFAFAAFAGSDDIRTEQSNEGAAVQQTSRTPKAEVSAGKKAPTFTLVDQFKKSAKIEYPSKSVNVFILADREGSKQVEAWVRRVFDKFGERIEIRGIALLKGVPVALRSTVRYMFKRQVSYPVLMDWDGEVTSQFPFKPGQACVVVVDTSGRIVASEYGAVIDESFKRVQTAIDDTLPEIKKKDN
jgi:hypothetical protein